MNIRRALHSIASKALPSYIEKRNLARIRAHRSHLGRQVHTILRACSEMQLPVFIVSYNNARYVENIALRLKRDFGVKSIVIDNKSTCQKTINQLRNLCSLDVCYVAWSGYNFGHLVGFLDEVYNILPTFFAYTDPDLELSATLPKDFLRQLSLMTTNFDVYKAGFALDLLPQESVIDPSIIEHESQFWHRQISTNPDVYCAPLDTTFAVYNKTLYRGGFYSGVRVAGDFRAVHLPWFPRLDLMNSMEWEQYLKGNISSSVKRYLKKSIQ